MQTSSIGGVSSFQLKVYGDERGRFSEVFRKTNYPDFVPLQDNYSFSQKGVLRGLHFVARDGQNQVLTVINGSIIDYIVDLRRDSKTFLNYLETNMNYDEINQIYIPSYCAHGFLAMSNDVVLHYKTDTYYDPEFDRTIQIFDPEINIQFRASFDFVRSKKDTDAKLAKYHTLF